MWKNWSGKTTKESTNHDFPSTPSIDDGMFCLTLSMCFVSRTLQLITAVSTDCVFLTYFFFFFLICYFFVIFARLQLMGHFKTCAHETQSRPRWYCETERRKLRPQQFKMIQTKLFFKLWVLIVEVSRSISGWSARRHWRLFALSVSTCQFVACSRLSVCRRSIWRQYR